MFGPGVRLRLGSPLDLRLQWRSTWKHASTSATSSVSSGRRRPEQEDEDYVTEHAQGVCRAC